VTGLRWRVSGLMVREVDGEVLLLDTESDQIHQLNRTASLIWRKCAEAASADEIATLLAREFDVEGDIALRDVTETLSRLRALNVLV
jgi:hypothetical protein